MDRFDIHVDVENIEHERLLAQPDKSNLEDIKLQIKKARSHQEKRFGSTRLNGDMNNNDIKTKAILESHSKQLLNEAAKKMDISARSYMRIIKVARTIADLENSPEIKVQHIAEALQYRPKLPQPAWPLFFHLLQYLG